MSFVYDLIKDSITQDVEKYIEIIIKNNKDKTISYNAIYYNNIYVDRKIKALLCTENGEGILFRDVFANVFTSSGVPVQKLENGQAFVSYFNLSLYKDKIVSEHMFNAFLYNSFSFDTFGCCNLFVQCSDQKMCLHDDLIYSHSCAYRKNLEQGRIFYGKNKNI